MSGHLLKTETSAIWTTNLRTKRDFRNANLAGIIVHMIHNTKVKKCPTCRLAYKRNHIEKVIERLLDKPEYTGSGTMAYIEMDSWG